MMSDDALSYPGGMPEAEELCPLLPPEMRQPGTVWPCRICGLAPDYPEPLRRCQSETVLFLEPPGIVNPGEDR
jgi:hypothetical protein